MNGSGTLAQSDFVPQSTEQQQKAKGAHTYSREGGYKPVEYEQRDFPKWLHHPGKESVVVSSEDEQKAKEALGFTENRPTQEQIAEYAASREAKEIGDETDPEEDEDYQLLLRENALLQKQVESLQEEVEEKDKLIEAQNKEIKALQAEDKGGE